MTFYHDAGKGSKQRPIEDKKKFEDNWDRIFGKCRGKTKGLCGMQNMSTSEEGVNNESPTGEGVKQQCK